VALQCLCGAKDMCHWANQIVPPVQGFYFNLIKREREKHNAFLPLVLFSFSLATASTIQSTAHHRYTLPRYHLSIASAESQTLNHISFKIHQQLRSSLSQIKPMKKLHHHWKRNPWKKFSFKHPSSNLTKF